MKEQIVNILKKPGVVPTIVGIVSGVGGFALGCFYSNRQWGHVSEELEKLQEDQARSEFQRMELVGEFNRLIQQTAHVTDRLREGGERFLSELPELVINDTDVILIEGDKEEREEDAGGSIVHNVFHDPGDGWDYEAELSTRSADAPYILHVEEYENDEMEFGHSTLTYYQGDDILTDEKDVPIYNYKVVTGELIFGHGSQDPSIVYVRNERLQAEYEVLLEHGYYQTEVLGEQVAERLGPGDIKHSRHTVPKFKLD